MLQRRRRKSRWICQILKWTSSRDYNHHHEVVSEWEGGRQSVISLCSPLITHHIRYLSVKLKDFFCARLHTIKRLIFVIICAPLRVPISFSIFCLLLFFSSRVKVLTKPSLIKHSIEQARATVEVAERHLKSYSLSDCG